MNYNNFQEKDIFTSLLQTVNIMEIETIKYLNDINSIENNTFTETSENIKKLYIKKYNLFSISLSKQISECEKNIFSLSHLIENSDRAYDADKTSKLSDHFDNYLQFSHSVTAFIQNNELLFSKKIAFNKKLFKMYAQNLLFSIQQYKSQI